MNNGMAAWTGLNYTKLPGLNSTKLPGLNSREQTDQVMTSVLLAFTSLVALAPQHKKEEPDQPAQARREPRASLGWVVVGSRGRL